MAGAGALGAGTLSHTGARIVTVNGVEYPASVAAHIPKYYLPKAHLQRQAYRDSAVLQCYVDPEAVFNAQTAYMAYAATIEREAVENPFASKFKPRQADFTELRYRRGGGNTLGIEFVKDFVLAWDVDDANAASLHDAVLRSESARPRLEPLLVRVPAELQPGDALREVLRGLVTEARRRLESSPQASKGAGSSRAPSPALGDSSGTAASAAAAASGGKLPWTRDALQHLVGLCEAQLEQLADEDARRQALEAQALGTSHRRGHRGLAASRRHGARAKAPTRSPNRAVGSTTPEGSLLPPKAGRPVLPPRVGLRPCDAMGALLAPPPNPTAAANAPPTPGNSTLQPAERDGMSQTREIVTPSNLLGVGESVGRRHRQTSVSFDQSIGPGSMRSPLSPGAALRSPGHASKHSAVATISAPQPRRQFDADKPLVAQLSPPFTVAVTIDRDVARDFVRQANTAARVARDAEVARLHSARAANVAARDARVREQEEASRDRSITLDWELRDDMRQRTSTGLNEVVQWQRERTIAERAKRLAAAEAAKEAERAAEAERARAALLEAGRAIAACEFDEKDGRRETYEAELASRSQLTDAARLALAAIQKRARVRERMRLVPRVVDTVVAAGDPSMFV